MNDLPAPAPDFREILDLIASARQPAYQAVNTALIDFYWHIGEHLSRKLATAECGEGVVGRINREEGDGSKSEKLAEALIMGQPIIIVSIQTFPFVLEAIRKNATLKQRNYITFDDLDPDR